MQTTRLDNGYMLVTVPGRPIAISTLKAGDVIRQSLSTELFVIERKYVFQRDGVTLWFRRLNADDYNSEPEIRMHFPADEMVWHVGELI